MKSLKKAAVVALTALSLGAPLAAQAAPYGWHGNFYHGDIAYWRHGHWFHGGHGGRLGWWWIVGGIWYFYPAPVYPYPDVYRPPVVVETVPVPSPEPMPAPVPDAGPAPMQYWYYCEPVHKYYPYVPSCPSGWKAVPAKP